jgi:hypothetical protein
MLVSNNKLGSNALKLTTSSDGGQAKRRAERWKLARKRDLDLGVFISLGGVAP